MRIVLYVLAAWVLVSLPIALFIGRLCSLCEVVPSENANVVTIDSDRGAVRAAATPSAFLHAS
jgi:hypothetical protein